jgi:nucleoside-diphosphate-sugar epimerase
VRKSQNQLFDLPGGDLEHILVHAAADLQALRGKNLFLTGGTGFFGKWLLGGLLAANDELGLDVKITVLSRNPGAFQTQFPELDRDDLRLLGGDAGLFPIENRQFDVLIHAAADTTVFTAEAEERERSRTIVDGTRRMLELAQKSGVQRMLNISSGAVYGAFTSQPTGAKEDDELAAITAYGKAKREAEQLCAESPVDFVTARAFAFLGPHLALDAHFAAGNFLRDALKGGPILVRGDGTALRSYLHPADLVIWLLRILVRGQRARAYNVGSDEAVTTAQLAHKISAAVQPAPEVIIQSVLAAGPQNIYLPEVTRARRELNLEVAIPLADAIARTLQFLKR